MKNRRGLRSGSRLSNPRLDSGASSFPQRVGIPETPRRKVTYQESPHPLLQIVRLFDLRENRDKRADRLDACRRSRHHFKQDPDLLLKPAPRKLFCLCEKIRTVDRHSARRKIVERSAPVVATRRSSAAIGRPDRIAALTLCFSPSSD
jgi:hypothetical protein